MKAFNQLFTLLFILTASAQAQELRWVGHHGALGQDRNLGVTVKADGKVYTAGYFWNTVDFDPSSGVYNLTSNGQEDISISFYDSNGSFVWAYSAGSSGRDMGRRITYDNSGNIYSTGLYTNTVDFDPGRGVNLHTSNGGFDVYVNKLDSLGNLIWAKTFGGSDNDDALDIRINSAGEILICGLFRNTVDFDPDSNMVNRTSAGGEDIFICKLDSNGSLLWVNTFGANTSNLERAYSLDFDDKGHIYLTGCFSGTVDFDPGTGIRNLTSGGREDAFLCKFDQNGNLIWAKSWGGSSEVICSGVEIGKNNDIFLGGFFRNTVDFDPGTGNTSFSSNGSRDLFFSKLDTVGDFSWAKTMGSISAEAMGNIAVDEDDNVYGTGYYFATFDADPGPDTFNLVVNGPPGVAADIPIIQLDKNGDFVWAYSVSSSNTDIANDIISDKQNHIYISGMFSTTADFDPQAGISNINSNGAEDAFIQKIFECKSTDSNLVETACFSYTSPSGKYTWTMNGVYTDTLQNVDGCDSNLTISLTINQPNITVTQNSNILSSNAVNANYQWLDCDSNYTVIPGATAATYVPTSNGNYAVEVTENGCTDTSNCIPVISVGINQLTTDNSFFDLFPNPSNGDFTLAFTHAFSGTVEIHDLLGKKLHQQFINNQKVVPFNLSLSSGLYLMRIESIEGESHLQKIIIQ